MPTAILTANQPSSRGLDNCCAQFVQPWSAIFKCRDALQVLHRDAAHTTQKCHQPPPSWERRSAYVQPAVADVARAVALYDMRPALSAPALRYPARQCLEPAGAVPRRRFLSIGSTRSTFNPNSCHLGRCNRRRKQHRRPCLLWEVSRRAIDLLWTRFHGRACCGRQLAVKAWLPKNTVE
jgi:hypothetical protein